MFNFRLQKKYRGVASLEMVMIVVILLPLFVLVLFIQTATMQKFNQSANTKYEAWKKRFETETSSQKSSSIEINRTETDPFMWSNEKQGIITATSSEKIQTGFMFDKWNTETTSAHTLISGTWDYKNDDTKMDSFPNIKTIAPKIALDEIAGLLNNLENKITNFLEEFKQQFDIVKTTVLKELFSAADKFKAQMQSLGNDPMGLAGKKEEIEEKIKNTLNKIQTVTANLTNQLIENGISGALLQQFQEKFKVPINKDGRIEIDKLAMNLPINSFTSITTDSWALKDHAIETKNFELFPEYNTIKNRIKNISVDEAQQFLKNPQIQEAITKLTPELEAIARKHQMTNMLSGTIGTFAVPGIPGIPSNPNQVLENLKNPTGLEDQTKVSLFLSEFVLPKVWEQGTIKDLEYRINNYLKEEEKLKNSPPVQYNVPNIQKPNL